MYSSHTPTLKIHLHDDIEVDWAVFCFIRSLQSCPRCADEYLELLCLHGCNVNVYLIRPQRWVNSNPRGTGYGYLGICVVNCFV